MIFVSANEIGLAEIVIIAAFRKMHFSGVVIFACQNGRDVTQNVVFMRVF